jgi:glyceraldehyde-3-phosphate dehydrogenase (NAD(P))
MMIRVGINGYGTIGRRVADAVLKQEDMELVGVTKVHPDYRVETAIKKGIDVYAANEKALQSFRSSGYSVKGVLDDLLKRVDVIVDCTPEGNGPSNKLIYEASKVRAIFQGGEEHELTGFSFVAQCNYEQAKGRDMVRVVSCNTTALCRLFHSLSDNFGIERARAILARRAADPDETGKGPIDSVVLDPATIPSHHGPDVQSVMGNLEIVTMAFKVPTTHMHLHSLIVTLEKDATRQDVVRALEKEPRVMLVESRLGFKSTSSIIDMARELSSPRNDIHEAVVWKDSVNIFGREVYMFMAVHQEAIVVPENVDAVRALLGKNSKEESMQMTDSSLGLAKRI